MSKNRLAVVVVLSAFGFLDAMWNLILLCPELFGLSKAAWQAMPLGQRMLLFLAISVTMALKLGGVGSFVLLGRSWIQKRPLPPMVQRICLFWSGAVVVFLLSGHVPPLQRAFDAAAQAIAPGVGG